MKPFHINTIYTCFVMFLFLVAVPFTYATFELSGTKGDVAGELWGEALYNASEFGISTFLAGENEPPEICDLDGDGEYSIFIRVGTQVREYRPDQQTVELFDVYEVGKQVYGIACLPTNVAGVGHRLFIWTADEVMMVNKLTVGGAFTRGVDFHVYDSPITPTTKPFCQEYTQFGVTYHVCTIGTNDAIYVFNTRSGSLFYDGGKINLTQNAHKPIDFRVFVSQLDSTFYYGSTNTFVLLDASGYTTESPEWNATTKTLTPLSNRYSNFQPHVDSTIGDIGMSNFGHTVVCVLMGSRSGAGTTHFQQQRFRCYSGTQVLFFDMIEKNFASSQPIPPTSRMMFYPFSLNPENDVCAIINIDTGSNKQARLRCYTIATGTAYINVLLPNAEYRYIQSIGNLYDVDDPVIIYRDESSRYFARFYNGTTQQIDLKTNHGLDHHIFFKDLDVDGRQEIIMKRNGYIGILHAFSTTPYNILVNSNLLYSGLFGFYQPTCAGTQITVKAKECLESFTDCTYFNTDPNRLFKRQRLVGDCDGSQVIGAWSYTTPIWTCTPSQTSGSFNVNLHLETDDFPNTIAYNFNAFNIQITEDTTVCNTNLQEEQDPNFGGEPGDPTVPPPDPTEPGVQPPLEEGADIFSRLNHYRNELFGILLIFGIVYITAYYGRVNNPFVLIFVATLALIFTNIIGLVPIVWTILLGIVSFVLFLLYTTVFKQSQSGE